MEVDNQLLIEPSRPSMADSAKTPRIWLDEALIRSNRKRKFVVKTMNRFGPVLGVACALALSACMQPYQAGNTSSPVYNSPSSTPVRSAYSGFGVVQSIDRVEQGYQGVAGTGYGLGTLAGALIGGLAGSQVGSGTGKTAAMVAGTAGGAYIGHQLETRNQAAASYNITVRMDNGSYQTLSQSSPGGLKVGDRVRIDNGILQRY